MKNKTYIFLVKYFLLLILSLFIVYISKSVNSEIKINNYSVEFLNFPDKIIDSVILKLNIDEKLDLIIIENKTELEINDDSTLHFCSSETFNSINDTTFLKEYLNFIASQYAENQYFKFDFLKLDSLNYLSTNYSEFIFSRYKLINEIFEQKNKIAGIQISKPYFDFLKSNDNEINKTAFKIDSFVRKQLPLIFIKYSEDILKNIYKYNGLTIIEIDRLQKNIDLNEIINSEINIVKIDIERKNDLLNDLKKQIETNKIDIKIIDSKLRKILKAKLWYKSKLNILNKNDTIKLLNINKLNNYLLKKKSITLVSNSHNIIPIKKTENVKFVVYSDIGKEANEFLNIFKFYASYNFYKLNFAKLKKIENKNDVYNIVLINQKLSDTVDNENITKVFTNFPIENTIFLNFSNYQNLRYFNKNQTIIQLSGNELTDFNLALQAIFGGIKIEGKLPYNISKNFNIENFNKTEKIRLSYTIPEEAEVNSEKLSEIDNIANEGISAGAFPGCQIFVAKDGKVIYNKSFGFQTYGKQNNVKWDDVYDLASVTKISATTIAAMKMIDQGKIKLNDKLAKFFKDKNIDYTRIKPDTVINIDTFFNNSIVNWKKFLKDRDTTNISDTSFISKEIVITRLTPKINIFKVQVIDLLKHKSGIVPALPIFRYIYYRKEYFKNLKIKISNLEVPYIEYVKMIAKNIPNTIDKNELLPDSIKLIIKNGLSDLYFKYFSNKKIKDTADIQIVDNLFLRNEFFDTIWRDTKQLPVYSRKVYQYSDINMILLQMAIDSVNRMSIDKYMKKQFFKPLSLKNISYSPLKYFSKNRIIPTENDDTWRFGLLKGYVHDPSASLLGGIAGNAGLYSNAHDLGVLFQMILNGGNYGKQQYIKQKTIEKFTKRFDDTQRALGFDMPNRKAIIGNLASKNTFGHSGYTGTCVWVDPDTKLVYVFLSNRNYTDSNNWRIVNYKIRERIHDAVYKAIVK